MTLVNILTRALVELGRKTDAQSMEAWREKLTLFANDGAADLAEYLNLKRVDTVQAVDGQVALSDLERGCRKVVSVSQNGANVTVTEAQDSKHVNVGTNGEVQVTYRYIPKDMENDIDEPDVPEALHRLIVTYVVYRDHLCLDPSMQGRATAIQTMYERGKLNARKKYGESDIYSIYNTEW